MSKTKPSSGTIRFHQWCQPPLPVGDYTVVVKQRVAELKTVKELDGKKSPPEGFSFSGEPFSFTVAGPRFALNPAEIYSVYPAEGSSGDFANSLPHIVFTRRTIPWERNLRTGSPAAFNAPWMALLLLSEGDYQDGKFPEIAPRRVMDLVDSAQLQGEKVAGPRIPGLQEYELMDPCNTIDLDAALFQEIAPPEADLKYLAHVREVNTDDKETLSFLADGWFSVVIGNRFPQPAQMNSKGADLNSATLAELKKVPGIAEPQAQKIIAGRPYKSKADLVGKKIVSDETFQKASEHLMVWRADLNSATLAELLKVPGMPEPEAQKIIAGRPYKSKADFISRKVVSPEILEKVSPFVMVLQQAVENRALLVSLEGMADYLRGSSVPFPKVRLAVLATWTFRCAEGFAFVSSMNRLDVKPLEIPFKEHGQAGESYVRGAFGRGYAALNHHTRRGEKTVSWYRGPLTPVTIQRRASYNFAAAPDRLVRYDRAKGMMDLTYAAAAQLGRLLALQDRSFSQALCAWRAKVLAQLSALLRREDLQRDLNSGSASLPAPENEFLEAVLKDAIEGKSGGHKQAPQPGKDPLEEPLKQSAKADPDSCPPASVCQWLARRLLLYGVPFSYLVPDERMLPPGSMRFFSLDPGWVKCLLEGACSVGRDSTREQMVDEYLSNRFFDLAVAASPTVRQRPPSGDGAPAIAAIATMPSPPVGRQPFTIMLAGKNFGASGSTVSFTGPESRSASAKGSPGVDLNSATLAELQAVPGIGEDYAKGIIAGRPYQFKIELERRGIVPADIFEKISKLVAVGTEVSTETKVILPAGSFMVTLKNDTTALSSPGFPLTVGTPENQPAGQRHESMKILEGFLLRSPLVKGWQGLEMNAVGLDDEPLTPLRIDRLSPEVMLCIFSGPLKSIEIRQPPEGMHFGAAVYGEKYEKAVLRSVIKTADGNGKGKEPGDQIEPNPNPPIDVPVSPRRVVEVDKLARSLHEHLIKPNGGMAPGAPLASFTSAEFGVQMTESPGRVTIKVVRQG